MAIDRAIEILDPEHREHYDGMDEVNEACRFCSYGERKKGGAENG